MQSLFHTPTCALVRETIPAPNDDGLLPPPAQVFAKQLPKQHAIISFFIYFSDLGKVPEN
jgi:hypothetical protein